MGKLNEYSNKLLSSKLKEKPSEDLYIRAYGDIYLFRSKKGDQIFAIEPCCDGADSIWLFWSDHYPKEFIPGYRGAEYGGTLGHYTVKDPAYFFKKKLEYGGTIDSKYFITQRGVKLGMSYSEVVKIYGPPDAREIVSKKPKISRYKWQIYGTYEAGQDPKIPKENVCPNMEIGTDYYIDFKEKKPSDQAIIIHIRHHVL